jgi:starch-binding outer membrane protein, SusD/RagB family
MKNKQILKGVILSGLLLIGTASCTNLEEKALDGSIQSTSQGGVVNTGTYLQSAYAGLRGFQDQDKMFAMDEMSGDGLVGPTRGGDWDDNGAWRQYHTHTWDPVHAQVRDAWNSLLSNVYNCNQVIYNNGTASEILQARFLRAFYYYNIVDLFGQAPYRPQGSDSQADPLVYSRSEGAAFCISELESILNSLPPRVSGSPDLVNQDAARFLLAKLYLNKSVFTGSATPADYTKVVQYVDAMTTSLAPSYWDNFKPTNNTSNEVVFSSKNTQGGSGGGIQSRWRMAQHYNQSPGGWNGFSTLSEYYNRFNLTDTRAKYTTPAIIADFGDNVGFLKGQMHAPGGVTNLQDRNGNPLIFTSSISMITSGNTLETAGIRGLKYIPDSANLGSPDNDYVLMRHSDALLMKVEAILRGGTGTAGTILADIAARAGVTAAPNTLDGVYAERGRELWWEGWRRNDMIRFGKFLDARELKPYVSASKYLLYPIPAGALLNSNIKQNPGY